MLKSKFFQNFENLALIKRPEIIDKGSLTSENLFSKNFDNKAMGHQKFRSGGLPAYRDFVPFFQKYVFEIFFFNFCCNLPRRDKLNSFLNRNVQNDFFENKP